MKPPSWMLIRVALDTHAYHASADADRLALMNVASVAEYRTLLARIYGFESAVELAIADVPALRHPALALRTRIGRLHDDLVALGLSPYEVTGLPRLTIRPRTTADAFGWLFVVARNMLLSGLIRRFLATQLPKAIESGSRYLDSEHDAGAQLRAFGDTIANQVQLGALQPVDVVSAATQAFQGQALWYARVPRLRGRTSTQPMHVPQRRSPRSPPTPVKPRDAA